MNNPGHMTKMATMPIYGKNPSKFFFSGTPGPISAKLGVKHWGLEYYNVSINYELWMTLTFLQQGQNRLPMHFNVEKLLKCHLKGINCRKWANGLKICDSKNI